MEEREIDLIDLLAEILSHWRGMLICMLLGAVLLGAFSYIKSYQEESALIEEEALSQAGKFLDVEESLKVSEKMAVRALLNDEKEYALYQQYMEESMLMQMDSYHIPTIEMLFKIRIDDIEQNYMLHTVYEDLVNGAGLSQWVEEQMGIPSGSVSELIFAQAKSDILVLNDMRDIRIVNDYMKVAVIHYDVAECKKLAQCVKDYIEDRYAELSLEFGAHEVMLLSETAATVMDIGVRDKQISCSNAVISLQTNIARVKEGLTREQQIYYDLLNSNDESEVLNDVAEAPVEKTDVRIAPPSVSMKLVIVGAFLFVFAYAVIFFVMYVLNNKLRAADELQKLYHITQFGLIVRAEDKKRKVIDRWIDALRNRNRRRFTREQSLRLAAAAVKMSLFRRGENSVCLTGCDLENTVSQSLKELLEKDKITVTTLNSVIYDAEEMEKLKDVKNIVLVEKAMSTMYNEILREIELISCQDIVVLGGIIVE